MSCFADLGSCQSCKSQEQCKRKGINMDKPLAFWPVFHHIPPYSTNSFTHLASCLTTHQLSPLKFLWSLVIAGVTGATGCGIIRAVRPAPFQGGRNSLHILEIGKNVGKTWKERDHLAVVFQKKTCSWIEIDDIIHYTSSPTQFKNTNTVCFSSDWRHWEILQNPATPRKVKVNYSTDLPKIGTRL